MQLFSINFLPYVTTFIISVAITYFMIFNWRFISDSGTLKSDLSARQASHDIPTPRLGGIGIFVAFSVTLMIFFPEIDTLLKASLLLSSLPVFIAGLMEDITRKITPRIRMLAAFLAGLIALLMTTTTIKSTGIESIDYIFAVPFVTIIVTLVWSAGSCHAFNLIDGVNGFSGSFAAMCCFALAKISHNAGDIQMLYITVLLATSILGFLIFNWPFGMIFLGDSGAYVVGHLMAWIAILIAARNTEVSGIVMLLIFFWPVADTSLAIIRRRVKRIPTDQPDRMHFHHLVMRILELKYKRKKTKKATNSTSLLFLCPLSAIPIILGVIFWNNPIFILVLLLLFSLLFTLTYLFGLNFARSRRERI